MESWRKSLLINRPISSYVYSEDEWRDIVVNELISDPSKGGTWGITHTKETKQLMAKAKTGKRRSKESCRKQSESISGHNNHFYGKKHDVETIEKMRKNSLGKKSGKRYKIKVIDNNGICFYDSLKAYADANNFKPGVVSKHYRLQQTNKSYRSTGLLKDVVIERIGN